MKIPYAPSTKICYFTLWNELMYILLTIFSWITPVTQIGYATELILLVMHRSIIIINYTSLVCCAADLWPHLDTSRPPLQVFHFRRLPQLLHSQDYCRRSTTSTLTLTSCRWHCPIASSPTDDRSIPGNPAPWTQCSTWAVPCRTWRLAPPASCFDRRCFSSSRPSFCACWLRAAVWSAPNNVRLSSVLLSVYIQIEIGAFLMNFDEVWQWQARYSAVDVVDSQWGCIVKLTKTPLSLWVQQRGNSFRSISSTVVVRLSFELKWDSRTFEVFELKIHLFRQSKPLTLSPDTVS